MQPYSFEWIDAVGLVDFLTAFVLMNVYGSRWLAMPALKRNLIGLPFILIFVLWVLSRHIGL